MIHAMRYLLFVGLVYICAAAWASGGKPAPVDILIISPHPDDAVLCCTGLIRQAMEKGETVHIVNVLDGDAHLAAAAAWFRKPQERLTHTDMKRFGRLRKQEDIRSLMSLGMPPTHITYLGYPDGLLDEVSKAELPLRSIYTGRSTSSESLLRPNTGASLDAALRNALTAARPKYIYLPASHDTALDHTVARDAVLRVIRSENIRSVVYSYINHQPTDKLSVIPSAPEIVYLTSGELDLKQRAIRLHASQILVDEEYLMSLASPQEWFYRE